MMLLTFSKLTIVILEDQGSSGVGYLIDEFTIGLSLSGRNNVTQTGKEQLATIALSYQRHCMDFPDCPTPSLSPTSKYNTGTVYKYLVSVLFSRLSISCPFVQQSGTV